MKILATVMLSVLFLGGCGDAQAASRQSFMPENSLHLQDNLFAVGGVDYQTFNDVISQVERVYGPIVASLGGNLVINRNWEDSTVNAYADRNDGNWNVSMFGGLARRPEVTRLGFLMVVCHETAHHLGGYPNYPGDWASDEGNSDYAGVHACVKAVLANTSENPASLSPTAVAKCQRYYTGQPLRVCYNIMAGAKSCADLLGALNGERVSFDSRDTSVVRQTSHEHPRAQCRLDTMSNAAVCKTSWNNWVIPSQGNYRQYSCFGSEDSRPACWFKS